ncbi:hypothetical protein AAIA71_17450 [Vibrio harveyi]|uniref:hypothetical protein n=1 Tax=Vibrio harveyi TaxID=669 RepID=UPI0004A2A217|nr:hypothetical protein [Vibrio harveyi]
MKRSTKISAEMYNLLIEHNIDGFSVLEARDALLKIYDVSETLSVTQKRIYRQIWEYQKKGWLRSEGKRKDKRYFQTQLFRGLEVMPMQKSKRKVSKHEPASNYSVLIDENKQYKGELEIALGEIDEYTSLRYRFPELDGTLMPLLQQANERSAHLLGKINVLTKVLKSLSEDNVAC